MNCKFVILENDRTVIAITKWHGKTYKGFARCSENDEWNEDLGKRLAAARVELKVARAREHQADIEMRQILRLQNQIYEAGKKVAAYNRDAGKKWFDAQKNLDAILEEAGVRPTTF